MTWPDESSHLDAELAAGRVSAEEYRRRRDAALDRPQEHATAPPDTDADTTQGIDPARSDPAGTLSNGENPVSENPVGTHSAPRDAVAADGNPAASATAENAPSSRTGATEPGASTAADDTGAHAHAQQDEPPAKDPFPPPFNWNDHVRTKKVDPERTTRTAAPTPPTPPAPPDQSLSGASNDTAVVVPGGFNPLDQPTHPPQAPPGTPGGTQPAGQPGTHPWATQPWAQQPPQQPATPGQQPPQWGQPQPGWAAPQWGPPQWGMDTSGTPWGNAELPPTPGGGAPWLESDNFATAPRKPRRGGLFTALSITGVVVIGLVVALIMGFTPFTGQDTEPRAEQPRNTQQQPPPPPPPPATSTLPKPPPAKPPPKNSAKALAPGPNPPHPWTGALQRRALAKDKSALLQPRPVLDFALQNGLRGGWFNGNTGPGPRVTLLSLRMPDERGAGELVQRYVTEPRDFSTADDLSYQGVDVRTNGAAYRTGYVAHGWAVLVEVDGKPDQQRTTRDDFQRMLRKQLEHTPPTVRD